ncbi:MAG: hypothetical protein P8X42_00690 [Calditrichaceae bacterium]
MRIISLTGLVLLVCNLLFASSPYLNIDHQIPDQAYPGEPLKLEVSSLNTGQLIRDARVFYRMQGMADYESIPMQQDGYIFSAQIPAKNIGSGNLEYYFAFQTYGSVSYLPDQSPEINPYSIPVLTESAPGQENGGSMDILLLSPDTDEVIDPDDFMIALSIPVSPADMNKYRFSLHLGGVDRSDLIETEGNLNTFAPSMIRGGLHNADFRVYDQSNQLLGEKSFSFRISGAPSVNKGLNTRTSVFANNRYHNISQTTDNLFRGGINHFSSYQKLDFQAIIMVSSEESYDQQPINQYGARLRYNFTPTMNLYLNGGDFSTNYDKLVFWEKRVRGIGVGYNSKFFDLDFTYGQTKKGVEGRMITDTTQINGTYKQSFLGIQPKFKYADNFSWGLNLVNAKDDPKSIDIGGNPKEALVLGTTMELNLHENRIRFRGSFQASMKNEDAVGKVDFDSLAEHYDLSGSEKNDAETLYNILDNTGFLTLSQGLSPLPSLAMKFQTQLKYFNQVFQFTYKNIDAEYTTPGNPYLLKDIRGLYINDKIRLLRNQLFLNLYFNSYQDRLSQGDAKTSNTQFGLSVSYYPFKNLPGVSLSYGNHLRENELAKENVQPDTLEFLRIEDTGTQRVTLSSSYKFVTGSIKNSVTISYTNYVRDDNVYKDLFAFRSTQSEYNIFTIGLRNQYAFPLISKIAFSTTSTIIGRKDQSRNQDFRTDNDINKIQIGLSYKFRQVFLNGDLQPFINFNHQNIKTMRPEADYSNDIPVVTGQTVLDYSRINYSFGFNFQTYQYGTFSLRYDYIDYGSLRNWSDTILSTGYEINL